MKKLISIAMVLSSTLCFSQLQKGNILIGGGLGVSKSKSEASYPGYIYTYKTTSFDITPRIGYFLSNRSAIGLEPGYSFSKYESGTNPQAMAITKTSTASIKPFYRYYFPIGDKVAFYLHARAGVSFGKGSITNSYFDTNSGTVTKQTQKSDIFGQQVSVSPGVAFFLSPKWSIESIVTALSYEHSKQKIKGGDSATSNYFNFYHNVFNLGLVYYINK